MCFMENILFRKKNYTQNKTSEKCTEIYEIQTPVYLYCSKGNEQNIK